MRYPILVQDQREISFHPLQQRRQFLWLPLLLFSLNLQTPHRDSLREHPEIHKSQKTIKSSIKQQKGLTRLKPFCETFSFLKSTHYYSPYTKRNKSLSLNTSLETKKKKYGPFRQKGSTPFEPFIKNGSTFKDGLKGA